MFALLVGYYQIRIFVYKSCLQCLANERVCFCTAACLLAYPFYATFPQLPWVGLFMAVMNVFFYLVRSCTMFRSILHRWRSSFTDSFHVFCGLHLPWQPTTSTWMQWFIHSSLLSTCSYQLKQIILRLDSTGGRCNHEYILYKLS